MIGASEQGAAATTAPDLYEVLNTRDVARILKCGVRKVQRAARSGELPMKLFGSEFIITRKRLQEYLDED